MQKISIEKAVKLLGRELIGKLAHVVCTSIHKGILFIDIDSEEPRAYLERNYIQYKGYSTHIRLIGTPKIGCGKN